jgi:hypothetical protein
MTSPQESPGKLGSYKNEHMVIPAVDHLLKPACQLGAPLGAEPALKNGEL